MNHRQIIRNLLVMVLLAGGLLAFVELVEVQYFQGILSPAGTWLAPPAIGLIAAAAMRGPVWIKGVFCLPVYPLAVLLFRIYFMSPPRDAGADAFLMFFAIGLSLYSVFALVVFQFFIDAAETIIGGKPK